MSKEHEVCAIVALGENNEIGKDNQLLWRVKEDLKRFRNLTTGHPIIMGRKTRESLPKPLPGRTNIVVTRNPEYKSDGCLIASSPEEAIRMAEKCEGNDHIFIIGGGTIYRQMMPFTDRIEVTHIYGNAPDADTMFPDIPEEFHLINSTETHTTDDGVAYNYRTYKRLTP